MDSEWTNSTWHYNSFNIRRMVSFIISCLIILLILLIPIESYYFPKQYSKTIAIKLIKTQSQLSQVKKTETIKTRLKPDSKSIKPIETPKPKPASKIAKNIHSKTVIEINSLKITKPQLPSAGIILDSLKNRQSLEIVDKDFQAVNNDFFAKSFVTEKGKKLAINDYLLNVTVSNTIPFGVKALKVLASRFSLMPIKEDRVKTQDTLPYCFNLGRNSSHCPSDNPLGN